MSKRVKTLSSEKLSQVVVKGMQEKKANEIRVLDLKHISNSVADYFIICSGNSDTHIDAIANSVEEEVIKTDGQLPWHKEGSNNKSWVLLDYVDVVVHIFAKESRSFYGIEDLWADAEITEIEQVG
ncbi:MAG: ribosome silencing factor [Cyclobacteriaceae bacterium]|nr:ribosome silencing factor [Cyclobacteriaceae bacterium]